MYFTMNTADTMIKTLWVKSTASIKNQW